MEKKRKGIDLSGLKDALWAIWIFAAVAVVLFGLVITGFTRHSGERESRTAFLKGNPSAAADSSGSSGDPSKDGGALLTLESTDDAGDAYLSSITWLCDSISIGLRNNSLYSSNVWGSEPGNLSMKNVSAWKIRFADGSMLTPSEAAMISKPAILVMAIGSDGMMAVEEETFISSYTELIRSIQEASPGTKIICCSIISPCIGYSGPDGLNKDAVASGNEWVKQICRSTGAYYANSAEAVEKEHHLVDAYSSSNAKALNGKGLDKFLEYFRTHALS